jgi:hypothetical protein
MIVDHLNIDGLSVNPAKTDSVLIVDANAKLTVADAVARPRKRIALVL